MQPSIHTAPKRKAKCNSERIVNAAQRLFRQTGFQKTKIADIARELEISKPYVYRFFSTKSDIKTAVCQRIFDEIRIALEKEIAKSPGPASETLRKLIVAFSEINARRFESDRNLHDLFETAHYENWPIVHKHYNWMDQCFEHIISAGMAAGEFQAGDARLASMLFRRICLIFCSSPPIGTETAPTVGQVVDFFLGALLDNRIAKAITSVSK